MMGKMILGIMDLQLHMRQHNGYTRFQRQMGGTFTVSMVRASE